MKIIQRKSDGKLFRPSYPDDFTGYPIDLGFYFREVKYCIVIKHRWWGWKSKKWKWVRTGNIWAHKEHAAFNLWEKEKIAKYCTGKQNE